MSDNVGRDQIRSIVERIERLQEEKKAIADDIKEVYSEAKANGFDTKTLRRVVSLRKVEAAERQEQEAMLDLYMSALGMQPSFDFEDSEQVDEKPPTGDQTTAAIVEAVQADEKETDQTELDNIGQDQTESDKAEPDESAEPEAEPIPKPEPEGVPMEEEKPKDGATKLSEEWTEGLEARKADKGPDENPYDGGEQKHHDWSAGYQTADEGIDKLRNEGYQARKDGQAATRCTFKKDSFEHTQWMAGYTLAKSEESD